MQKNQKLDAIITLLCLLFAYLLHLNTFIDWDVAWHLEGAKRLLQGGDYLVNLFDTNSPFVFAFYIPVIWLHAIFQNTQLAPLVYIYTLTVTLISLILCHHLVESIYPPEKMFARKLRYYAIVFCVLFLPASNFGQREVVLILFFLPYYLVTQQLIRQPSENSSVFSRIRWIFAVLAAFGILQNIFYLCLPVFLDSYKFLRTKKIQSYNAIFYASIASGLLLIHLLYPTYFRTIVPMVLCYESGFNSPATLLLFEVLTFMCLVSALIVVVNIKRFYHESCIFAPFGCLTLSLVIYFLEMKLWYYHLYPALCFAVLMLTALVIQYKQQESRSVGWVTICLSYAILLMVLKTIIVFGINEVRAFHNKDSNQNRWIAYSDTHFNQKKLFFIEMFLDASYGLAVYSKANFYLAQPWSNPWLMPYLLSSQPKINHGFCNLIADKKIFFHILQAALQASNPDTLIVEKVPPSKNLPNSFSYIDYFSQDLEIRNILKRYFLVDSVEKLNIYERKRD